MDNNFNANDNRFQLLNSNERFLIIIIVIQQSARSAE